MQPIGPLLRRKKEKKCGFKFPVPRGARTGRTQVDIRLSRCDTEMNGPTSFEIPPIVTTVSDCHLTDVVVTVVNEILA